MKAPVPARTARLTASGRQKMAKKLVEEAGEAALAAAVTDRAELIAESADLLYHLIVLWASLDIAPSEIWAEMQAREAAYGLAEKRAKHADLDCANRVAPQDQASRDCGSQKRKCVKFKQKITFLSHAHHGSRTFKKKYVCR